MCIVIDMNSLPSVFNDSDKLHAEFKPVLEWIVHGKGKMVYGGTTYQEELRQLPKYLKIIRLLKDCGKVVVYSDTDKVDEKERELAQLINHKDFDDPHLVAILVVSGCKLVCSQDERAYPYFKKTAWYKKGSKPKIYSGQQNEELLCDANIANLCQPSAKLSKSEREKISF